MPTGQDWVDVLDARSAGLVPGFAAHGAPIETADIHPDNRDPLDVEHFVGVERPTGDWRDVRIAELETQLGRLTGAPVDPRDARIAELTAAVNEAQAAQPAAAPTPPTTLPGSSYPPSAGAAPTATAGVAPPAVLEREPEQPVTAEQLSTLEQAFANLGRQLHEARSAAEVAAGAPAEQTGPVVDQGNQPTETAKRAAKKTAGRATSARKR